MSEDPFGHSVPRLIGMIWIALHVHHLRGYVLGFVAERVNNDAATDRTIRTRRTRFRSARDFQFLRLRVCVLNVETENGSNHRTCSGLEEAPACCSHEPAPSREI